MFAAETDTFIKLYAEPVERLHNILLRSGYKATGIRVFYTENEIAAMLACKQIII
jgi:hypothetical protein